MKIIAILSTILILSACKTVYKADEVSRYTSGQPGKGEGKMISARHIVVTDSGGFRIMGQTNADKETGTLFKKNPARFSLDQVVKISPLKNNYNVHFKSSSKCSMIIQYSTRPTMLMLMEQSCESVVNAMKQAVDNLNTPLIDDQFYAINDLICVHPKWYDNFDINKDGKNPDKMCIEKNKVEVLSEKTL